MLRKKFRAGDLVSVATRVKYDVDEDAAEVSVEIGYGALVDAKQIKLMRPILHAGEEVEEIPRGDFPEVERPVSGVVIATDNDHVWLKTAEGSHLTLPAKDLQLRNTNLEIGRRDHV